MGKLPGNKWWDESEDSSLIRKRERKGREGKCYPQKTLSKKFWELDTGVRESLALGLFVKADRLCCYFDSFQERIRSVIYPETWIGHFLIPAGKGEVIEGTVSL